MFRQIRFQTGELNEIIKQMKQGTIPCLDVDDIDDMNRFIIELSKKNIFIAKNIPFDRNSRDPVKEPEFEFRVAFYDDSYNNNNEIMYIDFYFEPDIEETYDSIMGD